MKVLMINGSPRKDGNTARALDEMRQVLEAEGIEVDCVQVGKEAVRGCVACNACSKLGRCVFDDVVNDIAQRFEQADGLVVGTPVYYGSANATTVAVLDRLFYSTPYSKSMKVGAAVAVARRGGLTATFDELNKYFTISGMPVASGQYWNGVHGTLPGECEQDLEGLQQMRTVGRNMAFLIKSIALGKEAYGLPQPEAFQRTNFVR
jgi:multimeric flavodoxin WrbA